MKSHNLARQLLAGPDLPVVINGWGSDEGSSFQVSEVSPEGTCSFHGTFDTAKTKRDAMGYNSPRKCLVLQYGGRTPISKAEIARERACKRKMERDRKRMSPRAFGFCYAEIKPISPEDLMALGKAEENQ